MPIDGDWIFEGKQELEMSEKKKKSVLFTSDMSAWIVSEKSSHEIKPFQTSLIIENFL